MKEITEQSRRLNDINPGASKDIAEKLAAFIKAHLSTADNRFAIKHGLYLSDEQITDLFVDSELLGLSGILDGMEDDQQFLELILGEYFARLAKISGILSSRLLFNARWGHASPEWFDHRLHFLDPELYCTDSWTLSADNAVRYLPVGGKLLDLCSGDGFYAYYFFRRRASMITCVEVNRDVYSHATCFHKAPSIKHINCDVLCYEPDAGMYDVVLLRGAVEHFEYEEQQQIFRKALLALRPGGWFCGDTVANPDKGGKLLPSHANEWGDELEMKRDLANVFNHVITTRLESPGRTTLFWQCQKDV